MKTIDTDEFKWPTDRHGDPLSTAFEPRLGIRMCVDCWNGKHDRTGCKISFCQCRCYQGKSKGAGKPHAPHKGCKEQQNLPDAGTITI